jgi:hypothetical protein
MISTGERGNKVLECKENAGNMITRRYSNCYQLSNDWIPQED